MRFSAGRPRGSLIFNQRVLYKTTERFILLSDKERRSKTIEAITDGFWEWNIATNELYISPKYKEFLGYTASELSNNFETLQDLIHIDDREKANTILSNALIGICSYDIEKRLRHKSGFYIWVHSKGAIFRDANNKVDFMICGANDITAKKETEIALAESERTLKAERSLFVSGPVAVFKWSAKEGWPIIYASPNVSDMLYASVDSLIDNSSLFSELIHHDDIQRVSNEVAAYIASQTKNFDQEYRLRKKNGEYGWFHDYTVVEYDENNNPAFINGYLIDTTDRKTAEEELKFTKDSLNRGQSVAHLGSWDLDLISNSLWWSDEIYRIFGLEPQEFTATYEAFLQKIHPEDLNSVQKAVNESIANKTPYEITHRILLKNKNEKIVREKGEVLTNENGDAVRMVGVVHDITEQVKAEEILRLREKQLSAIVDNLPVGVFFVSKTDGIILSNKAGEDIWGEIYKRKSEEFGEYKAWFADSGAKLKAEDWGAYKSLVFKENTINRKLRIEAFDGKEKIILESSFAIQDDKGRVNGAIVINEDITDREAYEKGLKEAKEQAEDANKLKSEFLANMSHEIRTPMNAVLGFAELLKNEPLDAKLKNFADGIIISGRNLLSLINDILDLSKIEAGKMTIALEATDLKKVLRELKIIFDMKAKDKGVLYKVNIQDDFPSPLLLDETRIKQILFNLLGNAIKFTEKGSVTLTASADESRINPELVDIIIKVEDTGIGIPKEQIEAIFEAFKQTDGQSTRKYGGTGLGLTISKKLSDIMGARLEVISEVGRGSIFTLTLDGVESAIAGFDSPEDDEDEATILIGTTLLVEDIATNRAVVKGFLTSHGVRIIEAENGKLGVEAAIENMPDLIIMDMQMPVMDGYEATKILKNNPATKHIPILALTASTMKEQKESIKAICDGYLQKPIDSKTLINELSKFLPRSTPTKNYDDTAKIADISPYERKEISRLLKQEWLRVNVLKSNDEIEEFARLVKKTAGEICSQYLNEYADLLIDASEGFKITQINKLFEQFEAIIKEPY